MKHLTNALLRRAAKAAMEHSKYNSMLTDAFRERYGQTYSDVDCDQLIDPLDYGGGGIPTLAECDEEMASCGAPKLRRISTALLVNDHKGGAA